LIEGAGDGEVEEEFEREAADGDSYLYFLASTYR
jgi:hypothetical protein